MNFACRLVTSRVPVRFLLLALLAVSPASPSAMAEEEPVDLSQFYGFHELEIFKLEQRSANVLYGDFNADGLNDLVLVDNSHSRIDLLQQRPERPDEAALKALFRSETSGVNAVPNDWRFEHRKISVDRQVASLSLGDFNSDKRTDLVYFGVPDRLIVRYQPESGDWTEQTSFRLPDVPPVQWILAAGDLNHDQRDDVAVLGKENTYLLYQQADGTLANPRRLMNTSDKLGLAQIADLDGDGLNDLCYLASEDQERTLCARLQTADGQLGPELRFELDRPRSVSLADLDGQGGREILTVDARTGRVKVSQLQRPAAKPGELASQLIQYGFGPGSGRDRDLATGDVDGDGLMDVVVSDPDAARMIVFRQHRETGLDLGTTYPGLLGTQHVRLADLDGDQADEIIVLSEREKTVGISRMEDGRLTFPRTLAVPGEPVVLEMADLNADDSLEIIYIARTRDGRDTKYSLRALQKAEGDEWKPYRFPMAKDKDAEASPDAGLALPLDLRGTPDRLMRLDANQDRRPDFLIFLGLDRAPHLFVSDGRGVPSEVVSSDGIQLGEVSFGAVSLAKLDEPGVLVAQGQFARNLRLDDKAQWQVADQYNAAESAAKIVGAATINLDGKPGNEVVLVDSGIHKLRVLRRDENVYRPWKEVEIGAFPFKSTRVVDLNHDGREDLLLFGDGKFAVLYSGQSDPRLKDLATYETKLENTYFTDVVAGDLNSDGRPDLAVIDTRSHFIEILDFSTELGLRHALHFKVFEEKSFSRRGNSGAEPREAVIVDVTNDGRRDLILLTHDRVLLYPQDDGAATPRNQPAVQAGR